MNRVARRGRFEAVMAERDLGGFLVSAPANVRYLTGYTGSNGIVCIGTAPRFMTDFRYATSVAPLAVDWQVEIVEQSLIADVTARMASKPMRSAPNSSGTRSATSASRLCWTISTCQSTASGATEVA